MGDATTTTKPRPVGDGKQVRAGGIEIHYVEAGNGPPLILLHGGAVSTNAIWNGHPFAYVSHMGRFAEHFRVIAADTRGSGRTRHDGGPVSFDRLADDVLALADALDLERPMICGFSEGGITATIAAIRSPERVRAVVNHAGHDLFNPGAPTFAMSRQMFGGSPTATRADHEAFERAFGSSPEMRATLEILKMDQDAGGGPGHWKRYLELAFDRVSSSPGYTFDDLAKITAPTLILTGDRDRFCSVEEAVVAYRRLERGELGILPAVGHFIPPAAIAATIDFLRRHTTNP
ncbi:MAG TPA: alpha/beta hydrolase [Polyangia bacterium]|jgi:pimeloyl-ACP methyl ester carboxylesterase